MLQDIMRGIIYQVHINNLISLYNVYYYQNCFYIHLLVCLSFIHLSIHTSIYPSIHPFIHPYIHLLSDSSIPRHCRTFTMQRGVLS